MKNFVNRKTEITITEESGDKSELGFANLAIMSLNNPPQGGWETSEMRKRIKVMDKLEKAELGQTVELEDAEFDVVVACAKIKWRFMHKDIIAYEDYLSDLKKS